MQRIVIQSEEGLGKMLNHLTKHDRFSIDFEYKPPGGIWKGRKNAWVGCPQVTGCSFAVREGTNHIAYYVPMGHVYLTQKYSKNIPPEVFFQKSKRLLESNKKTKVAHAAVVESGLAKQNGVELGDNVWDSSVMAWLYEENELYPYRLKDTTKRILGRDADSYKDVVGGHDLSMVPIDKAAQYGTDDALHALMLADWFEPELKKEKLWHDFEGLETKVTGVIRDMAIQGVWIDNAEADKQITVVNRRVAEIETEVYKEAGQPFNIRSGKQLGEVLFDVLKYPNQGKTPSGKQYKTDDATLAILAEEGYPVAELLREHGDYTKLLGTYLVKLRDFAQGAGGKFFAEHWQCGTKTGRYSGDFQQVPQDRRRKVLYGVDIHPKFLVHAPPGWWIIYSDYSQIELRLIAHFSQDPFLMKAYLENADLHQRTAELIEEHRDDGKTTNFALSYGLSEAGMIEKFGEEKGKRIYAVLREELKQMLRYTEIVHAACHADEYTRTLAGRKRRLPDINHEEFWLRSRAERQAFNALIQGSAADIAKIAQVMLRRRLPELKQAVQTHDSVFGYFQGTKKQAIECAREMKRIMETVVTLSVPIRSDPEVLRTWGRPPVWSAKAV